MMVHKIKYYIDPLDKPRGVLEINNERILSGDKEMVKRIYKGLKARPKAVEKAIKKHELYKLIEGMM
jgi:hypothetical protein